MGCPRMSVRRWSDTAGKQRREQGEGDLGKGHCGSREKRFGAARVPDPRWGDTVVAVLVLPVLWTLPETVPGRAKR